MNQWMKDHLLEIEDYPSRVFSNIDLLDKNLNYMRTHTDHEWFNIASVLLICPYAKDVKTIERWRDQYKDQNLQLKIGAKPIPILLPTIEDDVIQLSIVPVYEHSQLQMERSIRYPYSMIQHVLHKRPLQNAANHICEHGDGEKIIEEYIHTMHIEALDQKEFLLNCIRYTFRKDLQMKKVKLRLPVSSSSNKEDMIQLYRIMKDLVGMFYMFLAEKLIIRQKEKNEEDKLKMANIFEKMSIREQIEFLNRDSDKSISLSDIPADDMGIPEEEEGDSYVGDIE